MKLLSSVLLTLLLIACSSLQSADFSTPESTVETFINAAMEKDVEILSQCFSERSPGEWDDLRYKRSTDKDLSQGKKFVSGGTIIKTEMDGTDAAIVFVKFKSRDEKIHMVKENGRWYIGDF